MVDYIKKCIRTIPHFPKPGVMFRDIITLLQDPEGFRRACDYFYKRYNEKDINILLLFPLFSHQCF